MEVLFFSAALLQPVVVVTPPPPPPSSAPFPQHSLVCHFLSFFEGFLKTNSPGTGSTWGRQHEILM